MGEYEGCARVGVSTRVRCEYEGGCEYEGESTRVRVSACEGTRM